jgi:hypothetical protein
VPRPLTPGPKPLGVFTVAAIAATALFIGAITGGVLTQLLFAGIARSFDTAIYARGLWGLAHLDGMNPVVGVHAFSVHGHFGLLALAPLARFLDPAALLVAQQAAAAAATAGLTGAAAALAARARALPNSAVALIGCAVPVVAVPCSAWVGNPFLFDARPDLIGVPVVLAGLLRIRAVGRIERWGLALLLGSVLLREELAIVVAPALLLVPTASTWRAEARTRLLGALAATAYLAFYWLVLRRVFGGDDAVARVAGTGSTFLGDGGFAGWWTAARDGGRFKTELLLTLAGTAGGLAALGSWRYWLAAAPAVAWVVLPNRFPSMAIEFHYALFAAPLLLCAAVDGLDRVLRWTHGARAGSLRAAVAAVVVLVAAVGFATSSTYPQGGRYPIDWVEPDRDDTASPTLAAHRALAAIPSDVGVAVSYVVAAPIADRAVFMTAERLRTHMRDTHTVPDGVELIALIPSDAQRFRNALAVLGWQETAAVPGRLLLFRKAVP